MLIVAHLVNKFPAYYGTRRFIQLLTKAATGLRSEHSNCEALRLTANWKVTTPLQLSATACFRTCLLSAQLEYAECPGDKYHST